MVAIVFFKYTVYERDVLRAFWDVGQAQGEPEAGDEGVRATSLEAPPAGPQGRQTGMSSFSRRYKS
ncbi:MAG: hypothetical protein ACUVXJ_19240 [Phycisphaerae bacterium]